MDLQLADDEWRRGDGEQRRPATCAECRRLKLRCDKKVPCSTCTKRRCAHICPDGTLLKGMGKGKRLVLADSRNLFDKIDMMRKHIAELEAAIATFQHPTPTNPHETHHPQEGHLAARDDIDSSLSGLLGTLTLGEKPHFFGPNAASDYLLYRKAVFDDSTHTKSSRFSVELLRSGPCLRPGESLEAKRIKYMQLLCDALPPRHLAQKLAHVFFHNTAWLFGGARREDVAVILDGFYSNDHDAPRPADDVHLGAHDVAVLFIIFAFACILDPYSDPRMDDARKYYDLATLALSYDHILCHPTVSAIRAIHLMTWFLNFQDDQNSMCVAYSLMGLNAQLCKSLGMHLDDSAWQLEEHEKQSRRRLVWDMVYYNAWAAESMGRPPSYSLAQFNARLPVDDDAYFDERGEWQQSYCAWAYSFTNVCMLRALDQAFGARGASHATVLRLDEIIRDHPIGAALRYDPDATIDPSTTLAVAMQRANTTIFVSKLLLYLHRGFFALAISEAPQDPLQSTYSESFLAAFRSAYLASKTIRTMHKQIPFYERFPYIWSTAFSVSVILVSIVIKSPGCRLAAAARLEFEIMFELLEAMSFKSRTILRAMPSLRQLRVKATASYGTNHSQRTTDLDDFELAFIYGRTHCAPGREGSDSMVSHSRYPLDAARDTLLMGEQGQSVAEENRMPSYDFDDEFWANLGLASAGVSAGDSRSNIAEDQHDLKATWAGFMENMGVVDGFGYEDLPKA